MITSIVVAAAENELQKESIQEREREKHDMIVGFIYF